MSAAIPARDRFELFNLRAGELAGLRIVRKGMGWNSKLELTAEDDKLSYQESGFDEEELRSFLLLFRQFLMSDDPLNVPAILSECWRRAKSDETKQQVARAREVWKRCLGVYGNWVFVIDNKPLTGEKVLDLWLNGHYFHNDAEKAAVLNDDIGKAFSRMLFIAVLPDLTRVIMHVNAIIRQGLERDLFDFSTA